MSVSHGGLGIPAVSDRSQKPSLPLPHLNLHLRGQVGSLHPQLRTPIQVTCFVTGEQSDGP